MVHCLRSRHPAAGDGGIRHAGLYPVSSRRKHDLHRRRDMVRRTARSTPGGPPERAGLGMRPGRRRLHTAAARRPLLPAGHTPVARLLRLQHLLPAERQLRHRLQLRRRWNHHQEGSKFWVMQVPGIRDFCCFSADTEEHADDDLCCISDLASAESFLSCAVLSACKRRWEGWGWPGANQSNRVCDAKINNAMVVSFCTL